MKPKAMRDVFLNSLYDEMKNNERIFFITADFGSPVIDKIKADCKSRFINVGIAEQNLVNVAAGLALEGFIVYIYAIAPFITMRCYEQIRINISILSQLRPMNINLIGVGAGVSYAMSGPTHHCLEDLSIMNTLPNMEVFSPSDYVVAEAYVKRSLNLISPKYIRLDAKPITKIQDSVDDFHKGFRVLRDNSKVAIVSTGYMTQKAFDISKYYNFKLIDLYFINNYDEVLLRKELDDVDTIITIEEGFKKCGGLDSVINYNFRNSKKIINLGFDKKYTFEIGDREFIHNKNSIGIEYITQIIKEANL